MKHTLFIILLLATIPSLAQPIGNAGGGQANQNIQDKGVRSIDQALIIPILDTTQVNNVLSRLTQGTRKLGAFGRVGSRLWWFIDGRWQPTSDGGSGGGSMDYAYVNNAVANTLTIAKQYTDSLIATVGADGNNYVTGASFIGGNLILQRNALGNLSVTLDGRYSLIGHTHTISDIATLQQKLDDLQAQISGGGTAYTGANGVQVQGTVISLTDQPYTSAEKTKLAGIAPNATANSTDAVLLNRANHTGTQAISTVTGLQTALDARLLRSDSNNIYITPFTLTTNYYTKSQSDSRYIQNETDPVWNAQKVNYPTITQANANYAPASASYLYGSGDFGQIPVGTGTNTYAGSNTFTRIGGTVSNWGNFYVADSTKGYGFNLPNSDSTVYLKADQSGNILRQFVDNGTGDTSMPTPIAVDPSQTVTLTGAQTLTNKTLTAPVINNPTGITTANILGLDAALAGKEPTITAPNLTGRYLTGYKAFGVLNTDSVVEGVNRLYYTTTRVNGAFDTRFTTKTTSDLAEGTNLYYTPARARTAISATGPGLSYNNSTGVLTSTALTSETDPIFTASGAFGITAANRTDWTTAYNKRFVSAAITGTTTKTLTLTAGDNSTVTASFTDLQGSGGSGGTIASTTNILKGDGSGNAVAATPGTDYLTNITGLVTAGTNVTITGAGTTASPYNISSSGSGGGASFFTNLSKTADQAGPASGVADITNLTFPVTAGKSYTMYINLVYTGSGSICFNQSNPIFSTTAFTWTSISSTSGIGSVGAFGCASLSAPSGGNIGIKIYYLTFIAASSGTFNFQLSSGMTIKNGSFLQYRES